jgi:hypothetical protein
MEEQGKDVFAVLEKMQQQLTYLEKKIDTLIQASQQSQQKPFERERSFSKPPFRSFGRPHRPEGGQGGYGPPRGQGSYGPPRHEGGNRDGNFRPKKKPFFGGRSNRER